MDAQHDLYYLVYTSHQRFPLKRHDLRQILDQASHFNQLHQVTGMLIYRNGSFIQVLEGPRDRIQQLYSNISADIRHHQIQLVIQDQAERRYFADWSMGFCDLASDSDRELTAYTTFLREGLCAEQRPDTPSIPASLLTMFVHDFSEQATVLQ